MALQYGSMQEGIWEAHRASPSVAFVGIWSELLPEQEERHTLQRP